MLCREVYEAKISNGQNSKFLDNWIEFIGYLLRISKDENKAQFVFKEALKNVDSIHHDAFIQQYECLLKLN